MTEVKQVYITVSTCTLQSVRGLTLTHQTKHGSMLEFQPM